MNNLALLYKTQGKINQAEKMYLEGINLVYFVYQVFKQITKFLTLALEIRIAGLGRNHLDVAQTLNNLALL